MRWVLVRRLQRAHGMANQLAERCGIFHPGES
jgi:hypothetical protein